MRIERYQSRLSFRQRRRRAGCFPFFMLVGVALVVLGLSRDQLQELLNLALSPTPPDFQAAARAFDGGDLDSAVALAEQLVEVNPANVPAVTLLARALLFRSYVDIDRHVDRRRALEITEAALDYDPENLQLIAIHALLLQANNRPDDASRLALQVIEDNPDSVPARIALGLSYANQGIFEASLRETRRAVELAETVSPTWRMDSYRAQAISYSDLGQYDNAIRMIERAIRVNRLLIPLQFERALYALQIGDNDAATVAYFQVLAYDPENVKARFRLCELSSKLREREAAIRYCSEVTERAPAWPDGWYQLGHEYFLQGNFAEAQQALNRCSTLQVLQDVPIEERQLECWYLQGQAAEIQGDCQGLLATYNEFRAMAAASNLPQTWTYPPEGPAICQSTPTTAP